MAEFGQLISIEFTRQESVTFGEAAPKSAKKIGNVREEEDQHYPGPALLIIFSQIDLERVSDLSFTPNFEHVGVFARKDGRIEELASRISRREYESFITNLNLTILASKLKPGAAVSASATIRFNPMEGVASGTFIRLSLLPCCGSFNLSIRFLRSAGRLRTLSDIYRMDAASDRVTALAGEEEGLIIFAGPTGHGKTSAAYALLTLMASMRKEGGFSRRLVSMEDPIEARITNVLQVEIGEAGGFGFRKAFRHILRHDPDVIFIGEIRTRSSAKAALNAAMSGHLTIATIHGSSSVEIIMRLLGFELSRQDLARCLTAIISSRLQPKLCLHCSVPLAVDDEIRSAIESASAEVRDFNPRYQGAAPTLCERCGGSAEDGRIAICEIVEKCDELREWIARGADPLNRPTIPPKYGISFLQYFADRASAGEIDARWLERFEFLSQQSLLL
jgi:type IV pilus assembly protein PilB